MNKTCLVKKFHLREKAILAKVISHVNRNLYFFTVKQTDAVIYS